MQEKQILNVSQGIWIDERWLCKAGLGPRLQVEMKPGEIRIQTASETSEDVSPTKIRMGYISDFRKQCCDGLFEKR